jgi:ATP/maltotriose-dependent transcriptional regulator MalT
MPGHDDHPRAAVGVEIERGRGAFARQAWAEAHEGLAAADGTESLGPADLELLATSAYMIGREAEFQGVLERAHAAHLDAGDTPAALRCAFWIGATLAQKGETARAGGWIGRAQRLLEAEGEEEDCAERGYLLIPRVFAQAAAGEPDAGAATAAEAVAIGERFGDRDLFALAAHLRGNMLVRAGRLDEGLSMLDEAMVAVTAGETSPIASGIVYCGVILACRDAHEIGRAREWTAALSEWCERQPDLVAFTGRCRIHRAELMQLRGAWSEALEEARRARERALAGENPGAASEASYRQGEIHRLRGDFAAAEEAYREASRGGWEPQPGLALMRLAQGRPEAAEAAIDRSLAERREPAARLAVLPAAVEIKIATGAIEAARAACSELAESIAGNETPMLEAVLAGCEGAVELAAGDAAAALARLRRAWELSRDLEATYEGARVRVLVGSACRALGDEEAASLELDAAREDFERLGAKPDLGRVGALPGEGPEADHGLSGRELEVLRLVAAGKSNREIADELVISEHTVARHLQNIFAKLGVSSRTAASAYAFERELL